MTEIYTVFLVFISDELAVVYIFLGQKQAKSQTVKLLEEEVKNTRKKCKKRAKIIFAKKYAPS
jgi:glycerate kinase